MPLGEVFSTDFAEVRLPLAASDLDFIELPPLGRRSRLVKRRE